ncbi:MAG: Uma2 family endonuclease [Spirulinaceae cyanobacterium SM2_1_0]|nr:Uma2 family endonuclease [Spirulinaceae cyanobacterium SM2_1_0]
MTQLALDLSPLAQLDPAQFYALCAANPDLRLERTANGELIAMPPTGGETGRRNASINAQLWLWNQQTERGEVFDSSTGFSLPNGADRSPDAAWLDHARWQAIAPEQRERFVPLCPDFVIEILSPTDSLPKAQAKLCEYVENGCRWGWLLARRTQLAEVYRPNQSVEMLSAPLSLSGDPLLPGFVLDLSRFWS